MRKKHGTVRTAFRPSGSVNRDRFGWFGLFQPLNDVVQLLFFFFFFPLNGVVLKRLQHIFFFPPIRRRSALSQNHSSETLSHFSITLNPHLSLPLSKITLKSSHSQVSISPRAVALSQLSLSPSRCRTSQLSLFVTLSSHFVAQPLSRVAVAAQPRSQLPRRRHTSAQVFYLWYYQYQRFRVAVNTFSLFFWNFFFFGYDLSEIFVCGYVICLSILGHIYLYIYGP